ncbi:hypothetical protein VNO77_27721 [Canavalia gladiata]|uniref:Uncharacterized protein n=1 Tax=Canavalia gladiata TaxID=3824 RepID=A0AAN9KUI8_CANGL
MADFDVEMRVDLGLLGAAPSWLTYNHFTSAWLGQILRESKGDYCLRAWIQNLFSNASCQDLLPYFYAPRVLNSSQSVYRTKLIREPMIGPFNAPGWSHKSYTDLAFIISAMRLLMQVVAAWISHVQGGVRSSHKARENDKFRARFKEGFVLAHAPSSRMVLRIFEWLGILMQHLKLSTANTLLLNSFEDGRNGSKGTEFFPLTSLHERKHVNQLDQSHSNLALMDPHLNGQCSVIPLLLSESNVVFLQAGGWVYNWLLLERESNI